MNLHKETGELKTIRLGSEIGADHGGVKTCFHPLRMFVYENFIY